MAESETSTEAGPGALALGAPAPGALGGHPASQFRGRGEYAIDDKGRLTLPPQMRKALLGGGSLVVLDGRAVVWDEPTYRDAVEELQDRVRSGDLTSGQLRAFLSSTHPVSPDTQGRIVIPHAVRIEAGLERDVLVLGAGRRIEIVPVGDASLTELLAVDDDVVQVLDRALF